MLTNLVRCDDAERRRHAEFLFENTPIKQLASGLYHGRLVLYRGTVTSLQALAETDTIFGNLGETHATRESGRDKFRVGEVRAIFERPGCTDRHGLRVVRRAMEAAATGRLAMDLVVNLLYDGQRLTVVDGNHRAAAFVAHHLDAGSDDAIELQVYIVTPIDASVPTHSTGRE
jgi:hypothetical protein